jgi:hypothetical protein
MKSAALEKPSPSPGPFQRRRALTRGPDWSDADEQLLLTLAQSRNQSLADMQKIFLGRSLASIRSKLRKLRIATDSFGIDYRQEKTAFTRNVASEIPNGTVFEAYAGAAHQTLAWAETAKLVLAAEIDSAKWPFFKANVERAGFHPVKPFLPEWLAWKETDRTISLFRGDAVHAAAVTKVYSRKIDLVDLDTCGSTIPSLPIFLSLLRPNHLVITHGEFHSLRFKREDVLRRILTHRDISTPCAISSTEQLANELHSSICAAALRAHNDVKDSYWLTLNSERWLGAKNRGMLRRHYLATRPPANADCLNELVG